MGGPAGKLAALHRLALTVKINRDSFETYESIYVDKVAGYSDIAVKDGKLFILYEQRWGSDGLHFKVIE